VTHSQQLIATIGSTVCWVAFVSVWVVGAIYNAARGPRQAKWKMLPIPS
jgi:hypothetical protein